MVTVTVEQVSYTLAESYIYLLNLTHIYKLHWRSGLYGCFIFPGLWVQIPKVLFFPEIR